MSASKLFPTIRPNCCHGVMPAFYSHLIEVILE
jgi:hypothetical protein